MALDPASTRLLARVASAWSDGDLPRALDVALEAARTAREPLARLLSSRALAGLGAAGLASELAAAPIEDGAAPAIRRSAERWRLALALSLGRTHDARDALVALTRRDADAGLCAEAARILGWMGATDLAWELAMRAVEGGVSDGPLLELLSSASRDEERRAAASGALARAADATDDAPARALVEALLAVGSPEAAERISRSHRELADLEAELRMWRGDDAGVDAALAKLGERSRAARVRAARALWRGRLDDAEVALADAIDDPVTGVLRAELALRRGRLSDARREIIEAGNRLGDSSTWIAQQAVHLSVKCAMGANDQTMQSSDLAPVRDALADVAPDAALLLSGPRVSARELRTGLETLLARLGPNRTPWPYVREAGGALRAVSPVESARERCIALQGSLRSRPLHEVLEGFAALAERHPGSPHVAAYHGEVLLWWGRYAEAAALFRGPATSGMRWPPIGMAAAALLCGDVDAARRWLGKAESHPAGPGPTWFAWRGEWLLACGRHDEARAVLEHAVRETPSRLGARVALALLCAERGPAPEAGARWDELCRDAPGMMHDAAAHAGAPSPVVVESSAARVEVLRAALASLRGNRSSTVPFHFDARGAPAFWVPEEWRRPAMLDAAGFSRLLARLAAR